MKITIDGTAAEVVELVTALSEGLVELIDEYRDDYMDDDWEEFDSEDGDDEEDEGPSGKYNVLKFDAKGGCDKNVTTAVSQIMNLISDVVNHQDDGESDRKD